MTQPRLFFLHLPRTGGTTFRDEFLIHQYTKEETLWVYPRTWWAVHPENVEFIPTAIRGRYNLVCGHFKFGIHEHFGRNLLYATIIREPVSRVVSSYYHHARSYETIDPALHSLLETAIGTKELSLEEYVKGEGPANTAYVLPGDDGEQPFNICTRWIAGYTGESGTENEETLSVATSNLAKYFDYTAIDHLADAFPHRNRHEYDRNISPHIEDLILEHNQLDQRLYQWVKKTQGENPWTQN